MKKIILLMFIAVVICAGVISFKNTIINRDEITRSYEENIKISETVYLDYITEINFNRSEFLGKTVEIEGMFTNEYDKKENKSNSYIYRLSDNVHYDDDVKHIEEVKSGFRFVYDGDIEPKENDWIKVIGILEEDRESKEVYINASSLEIMKVRGLEKIDYFY